MNAMHWGPLSSSESLLFEGTVACVGRFRCAVGDPLLVEPTRVFNDVFAFPHKSIWIAPERARPFVAGSNVIPLYNIGECFSRSAVELDGEFLSEWYAVAHDVLVSISSRFDDHFDRHPQVPFRSPFVPCSKATYLQHWRLLNSLSAGAEPLAVEERIIEMLEGIIAQGTEDRLRTIKGSSRSDERVEFAKQMLGRSLNDRISIRELARETQSSVYHLCRIFRRKTGFSLHAYRHQLRLRRALDEVPDCHDLLGLALRLGFNDHSHFTYAFRKEFEITPAEFRKSGGRLPGNQARWRARSGQ